MGCLCCRDREKLESEALPLDPIALNPTNPIESPTYRCPNVRSDSRKPTSQSTNSPSKVLWTPQLDKDRKRQLRVMTDFGNLNGLAKTRRSLKERSALIGVDVSLAVKGRNSRVVLGGLESCYRLTETKCGSLTLAEHRETMKKCWVRTYELKRESGLKEAKRELWLMKALDHPNVLKVLDLLQEGSEMHAVYEATEGGNAQELHRELGEPLVAAILRQVLVALSHCQSKDLVLKPISFANVLFVDPPTMSSPLSVKLLVPFSEKQESSPPYIAPELGNEALVGQANCLWSCGVLLSTLLTGEVSQKKELMEFKSAYAKWRGVSAEAKSLTLSLLSRDYRKRPSLEQCLQHPWLAANQPKPSLTPALRTAIRNMTKLRPATSLKKAVLQLMLNFVLGPDDLREVKQAFIELDTDKDGAVTEEELREQIYRLFPEEQAQSAFTALTSATVFAQGKLAYSDFLLWACGRRVFASPQYLDATFRLLDTDKDGTVTHRDLREFFSLECENGDFYAWQVLVSSVSTSMEGFHYEELSNYLQKP